MDMQGAPSHARRGEYAVRGEYHRQPDPSWDYYPTYLAKLEYVERYLAGLPPGSRVLDAGCGEGVLVERHRGRLNIVGVDPHYASAHVTPGSVVALPFANAAFGHALCLDVLEHLSFEEQPRALRELHRVVAPGGEVLSSVPNLAHLQSRVHFVFTGRLIRTASEHKHPGDRPIQEYLRLFEAAGFAVVERHGIFPTVPILTRLIRRHPSRLAFLHRWLTRFVPVPDWCFLNIVRLRRQERP
jgi:2-polyprenyl-3-methyl-5-hydroxy-6-metoxy-1,4-benzoquinol methylase